MRSDSELKAAIETNETRVEWGAWAIVVGLVIEVVLAIVFPSGKGWIEDWGLVGATALIALGVYTEIHFGRKGAGAHKDLQSSTESKLTEALNRAARAEESLAELRRPRREIFRAKGSQVTEAVKPFAGTIFDTGIGPTDQDAGDALWDIEPLLWAAGWEQIDWTYPDGSTSRTTRGPYPARRTIGPGLSVSNVSIHIHPGSEDALGPAATALVTALNAIGVDAKIDPFNIHNGNANAMHVLIGPKF